MTVPRASILLATRNGVESLPAVLDGLARQETDFAWETVVVDSESTDGTLEVLDGRVDRLIRIPAESFDHGLTRNLGIEHCRGEWVPESERWLAELTRPFLADGADWRLAGT